MNRLHTYADAILNRAGPARIVRSTTENAEWMDADIPVRQQATTYWFGNGVVIRRTCEEDDGAPAEGCALCLIRYEVLSNGDQTEPVMPRQRDFDNRCRESFWLAIHRA